MYSQIQDREFAKEEYSVNHLSLLRCSMNYAVILKLDVFSSTPFLSLLRFFNGSTLGFSPR